MSQRSDRVSRKRKRSRSPALRKCAKILRNSGLSYVNKKNQIIEGKLFKYVDKCCCIECFRKVDLDKQFDIFTTFYAYNDKEHQDISLTNCMSWKTAEV